jgi:hypothetical protein
MDIFMLIQEFMELFGMTMLKKEIFQKHRKQIGKMKNARRIHMPGGV